MLQNASIRYTAQAVYQHDLDENSGTDGNVGGYVAEGCAPDAIFIPSDDFYNVNTTNFNRNPQVNFLIPRKPYGRPQPGKFTSNKP